MDIELILKQIRKKRIVAILLIFTVFFAGCDEPYDIAEVWICEKPQFVLTYSRDEDGILTQSEVLEWNGETMCVDLLFNNKSFCVYPDYCNNYDCRLFSGTWKIRGRDLVLFIDEDFLFNGEIQELIFSPVKED